ncbi:hypothetical protein BC351_14950 [Paenibacillus ferrarius]|uniref:Uncharacterized protein n=1 Tax=Paenibacillus ferrarius TaxID=1469647 RepID=A0A1V4HRA9_9BACL|nr:hypothetical protein BC351_14950 [Paenibacillus ferrarius]
MRLKLVAKPTEHMLSSMIFKSSFHIDFFWKEYFKRGSSPSFKRETKRSVIALFRDKTVFVFFVMLV